MTNQELLLGTVLNLGVTSKIPLKIFPSMGLESSDFHTRMEKALFKELNGEDPNIQDIHIKLSKTYKDWFYWSNKLNEGVPKFQNTTEYMQKLARLIITERLTRKLFESNKNFEDHITKTGNFDFPNWNGHKKLIEQIERIQSSNDFDPISSDKIEEEELKWLWLDRIPLNKLVMISGDPDSGKSLFCIWLCAAITKGGPWPDGTIMDVENKGSVIYCNAEDDKKDTIKPRIIAMGGIEEKIHVKGKWDLLTEMPMMENFISRLPNIRLLVIDNVDSFCDIQGNESLPVHEALLALTEIAQKYKITIIFTRHLNKDETKSILYRTTGSMAWVGTVRACWGIQKVDSEDNQNPYRYLAAIKNNLALPPKNMKFKIEGPRGKPALINWQEVEESSTFIMGSAELREQLSGSTLAKNIIIEMIVKKKNTKDEIYEEVMKYTSRPSFYRAVSELKKSHNLYGRNDDVGAYRYHFRSEKNGPTPEKK